MEKITLTAENRLIAGRKVRSLRFQGLLPAVIYGHGLKPMNIQLSRKDFEHIYSKAGESTLVYLRINGEEYPTIIHDAVLDPISSKYLHADFYRVRLDEKIKAAIHLNFIGESPAVKELGGILVKNISELDVEGFPQDLPSKIDVDVSSMTDLNSHILVKDLAISGKLAVKTKPDEIIALVQEPISEEELKAQLETPAAAPEEVEVIKKEKIAEEPAAEEPAAVPAQPEKK